MNEAPPAASTAQKDFGPRFDPLPGNDTYIFTVVAFDFIKNYEQRDMTTGEMKVFDALQFFYGTKIDGKAYFLKPWPTKYSIHEKANYTKLFKAAVGNPPPAGSNPKEMLGKGVTIEVENEEKVSKKGTKYTISKAKNVTAVHAKLKGEIVPLAELLPAFEAALASKDDKNEAPF
jgi:hypothetical protein